MKNAHVGTDFDGFLNQEWILEEVTALALKRVSDFQLKQLTSNHQSHNSCALSNRLLVDVAFSLKSTIIINNI